MQRLVEDKPWVKIKTSDHLQTRAHLLNQRKVCQRTCHKEHGNKKTLNSWFDQPIPTLTLALLVAPIAYEKLHLWL